MSLTSFYCVARRSDDCARQLHLSPVCHTEQCLSARLAVPGNCGFLSMRQAIVQLTATLTTPTTLTTLTTLKYSTPVQPQTREQRFGGAVHFFARSALWRGRPGDPP